MAVQATKAATRIPRGSHPLDRLSFMRFGTSSGEFVVNFAALWFKMAASRRPYQILQEHLS